MQSVSVAVESSPWYANRLKTISRITVQIAQHGPRLLLEGHWVRDRHRQRRVLARFAEDGRRRLSREAGFAIGVHERRCPGAAGSLGRFREKCRRTESAGQT